jgi:transposase
VTRVAVACSAEQKAELVNLARSRTAEARLVERARIVLACLEGKRNDEVSRELGVRPNTVGLWRKRFAAGGIAGLRGQARPGKKPKYGAELRQRILRQLELPPPPGLAGWDGGSLAAALGVSDDAVWRVLRHDGIQLRRHRSWCVSTDPQFAAKAADIIGLYLNPPQHALVLSVDEKPSIQALERATGHVQTSSGRIVRGLKSTYKRHGTVNLFAALEVATGIIRGKTTQSKKRVDFQAFMSEIVDDQPADRQIHVILDNQCTHKKNDACWPRTPMSPSTSPRPRPVGSTKWRSGSAFSPERPWLAPALAVPNRLRQAIQDFTTAYNEHAGPFVWRNREVKGSQLRHTIVYLSN